MIRAGVALAILFFASTTFAQPSKGAGATPSAGGGGGNPSGGTSSGLTGVSFLRETWPTALTLPDIPNRVVVCFKLKRTDSFSQPFVAEPAPKLEVPCYKSDKTFSETDPRGRTQCVIELAKTGDVTKTSWNPCSPFDRDHPMKAGDILVVAYDARDVGKSAADPNMARIRLVNLNVATQQNQPVDPTPFRPNATPPTTAYDGGGGAKDHGIYYVTWPFELGGDVVPTVALNFIFTPPVPGEAYHEATVYPQGSIVLADNHHYYVAVAATRIPPIVGTPALTPDGAQSWLDIGGLAPAGITTKAWAPAGTFNPNDVIFDPQTGHYFQAQTIGKTDPASLPKFQLLDPGSAWRDLGTAAPASLSSGPAADQTVNAVTLALPQVHTISSYSLAAGLVFSGLKSHSFGLAPDPSDPTGKAMLGTQVSSTHIVDPVLFFTYYPCGIDAERLWHSADLRPGISAGLSLSSPTNNYYFGLSFEIRRSVQFVAGVTIARISELADKQLGTSAVTTVQRFEESAFAGMSFNVSGFIQSLFSSGGKSSSQ